jgi:hypothetical protein
MVNAIEPLAIAKMLCFIIIVLECIIVAVVLMKLIDGHQISKERKVMNYV